MLRRRSTSGPVRRAASAYRRDAGGVAAVEFALLLPLILILYVAAVDVTRAVMIGRRLDLLSRTISDLVSQQPTTTPISANTVTLIFGAAAAVVAPYPTSALKLTVSAVDLEANSDGSCCQAVVRWSFTQNGTLRACAPPLAQVADGTTGPTTIPSSLILANKASGFGYATGATSYLIVADVSSSYTPFFPTLPAPLGNPSDWFKSGMSRTTFMVPRASTGTIRLATPITPQTGQSGVVCF